MAVDKKEKLNAKLNEAEEKLRQMVQKRDEMVSKAEAEIKKQTKEIKALKDDIAMIEMKEFMSSLSSKGLTLNEMKKAVEGGNFYGLQEKVEEQQKSEKEQASADIADIETE